MAKRHAKPQPEPPPLPLPSPEKLDQVVLLAISGVSESLLLTACQTRLGLSLDESHAAITEANARILAAASRSREIERGTAITRLNDLYRRATKDDDLKSAIAAQRELNRIWRLHETTATQTAGTEPASAAEVELELIRSHLVPLALAEPTDPLAEHARLAAALITAQP